MVHGGFNRIEYEVMNKILEGDDPFHVLLRRQFSLAELRTRKFTGVGFYTYFSLPADVLRLKDRISGPLHGGPNAEIEGLKYGAGFVLFLKDGVIDNLEGFTYDEKWPTEVKSFRIIG